MRRAIVHIGMPRTGSTSLQELLTRMRPALAGSGLSYPELGPPGTPPGTFVNHQPLAEALDGRRPAAERAGSLNRLAEALADTPADTVILSYEDFALQKPSFGVPAILGELFSRHGFAMEVALVVKPQPEQLNSAYGLRSQVLREMRRFRGFAQVFWWSGWFDYPARLEPWRRAAQDRVTAIPFRDRRSDAPLTARVLDGLGLADRLAPLLAPDDLRRATNRGPGPLAVEASRRMRLRRIHRGFRLHPRVLGHALDLAAWSRGLDAETFRGDAPEIVARMVEHFATRNERFAQTVWGAGWDAIVATSPAAAPNELAAGPIPPETDAQVEALIGEVASRFGLRSAPAWRAAPVSLAEEVGESLARRVGYSRWRVV